MTAARVIRFPVERPHLTCGDGVTLELARSGADLAFWGVRIDGQLYGHRREEQILPSGGAFSELVAVDVRKRESA